MTATKEIFYELSHYDINSIILTIGVLCSYFVGHISPARIMAKLHGIDIEKEGSGNPGTTNVQRTMGNSAGAITLVIDIAKGAIVVILALNFVGFAYGMFCGLAAILGHMWPLFYELKGGKGVATTFGVLVAIDWMYALVILIIVLVVFLITRTVSTSVIVGAIAAPIIGAFFNPWYTPWTLLIVVLILIRHIPNMRRILSGIEPKVNFSNKGDDE